MTTSPWTMRYLLFIAGMGGLLYGIDVGIIAGALPYLESTASVAWKLSAQQLSFIVAAVLLGSVLSSLFAGALADAVGRRWAMVLAGALFTASIPVIALADGYTPLLVGRLLQGISGGLIGVVVPLYLAECLPAAQRGRGAALFQLLLTVGLVGAAVIGLSQANTVDAAIQSAASLEAAARAQSVFAAQDHAWRSIFWLCLGPGLVFTAGAAVTQGVAALAGAAHGPSAGSRAWRDNGADAAPLLSRRYLLPFGLACLVLALTQATGINSILAYVVNILNQAGLPGATANAADVGLKVLNAVMTVVAVMLVDRKGRKFLLKCWAAAASSSLCWRPACCSSRPRRAARTCAPRCAAHIDGDKLNIDAAALRAMGATAASSPSPYAYGPFTNVQSRRMDDAALQALTATRADTIAADSVIGAFFRKLHLNPFADPAAGLAAPLTIERAWLGEVPPPSHGWKVALAICLFVASFAVGPGVCVWLALSELMPTRIRSNGMSIALLINQFVSTVIAAIFLPTVGYYGYATLFFVGAGCTAAVLLDGGLPAAGDQGQDAGRDRGLFCAGVIRGGPASAHRIRLRFAAGETRNR